MRWRSVGQHLLLILAREKKKKRKESLAKLSFTIPITFNPGRKIRITAQACRYFHSIVRKEERKEKKKEKCPNRAGHRKARRPTSLDFLYAPGREEKEP